MLCLSLWLPLWPQAPRVSAPMAQLWGDGQAGPITGADRGPPWADWYQGRRVPRDPRWALRPGSLFLH